MFKLRTTSWSQIKEAKEAQRKVTIIIVGLDNSGKTTCTEVFCRYLPSRMDNYMTCNVTTVLLDEYEVSLYDLNGDMKGQETWSSYYEQAHGLIFVLDSSDLRRMREMRITLTDMLFDARVAGKPILILANKQDKKDAILPLDIVNYLFLEMKWNGSKSMCRLEPCSAIINLKRRNHQPIIEGLRWLLAAIKSRREDMDSCQQSVTSSIPTSMDTTCFKETHAPESFTTNVEMPEENRQPLGQHSMKASHLKPIPQKERLRFISKTALSVKVTFEEPMERGECSGENRAQNTTEVHYKQSVEFQPLTTDFDEDEYDDDDDDDDDNNDDLLEEPRPKKRMATWHKKEVMLEDDYEAIFEVCEY